MSRAPEVLVKTPWEEAAYSFTFPTTITSVVTLYSSSTSIVVGTPSISGTRVSFTIGGGVADDEYVFIVRVVDLDGRRREGCGMLKVRSVCS